MRASRLWRVGIESVGTSGIGFIYSYTRGQEEFLTEYFSIFLVRVGVPRTSYSQYESRHDYENDP